MLLLKLGGGIRGCFLCVQKLALFKAVSKQESSQGPLALLILKDVAFVAFPLREDRAHREFALREHKLGPGRSARVSAACWHSWTLRQVGEWSPSHHLSPLLLGGMTDGSDCKTFPKWEELCSAK